MSTQKCYYYIQMISSKYRFHGHGSLRYVYKNGQALRSRLLTIKYTRNTRRRNPRFAVVVSKKVHKSAVGRNRIRRRLYEILRGVMPRVTTAHDIVCIVSSGEVMTMEHTELEAHVQQLLAQSTVYGPKDDTI